MGSLIRPCSADARHSTGRGFRVKEGKTVEWESGSNGTNQRVVKRRSSDQSIRMVDVGVIEPVRLLGSNHTLYRTVPGFEKQRLTYSFGAIVTKSFIWPNHINPF